MKQNCSMWRFLREELESERLDLVFLLRISIPLAVIVTIAVAYYFLGKKLEDEISPVFSRNRQTSVQVSGESLFDPASLTLKEGAGQAKQPDQRGDHDKNP